MSNNPKRVLLITYSFPPTGNVGVLRPTKFCKYLPEFDWKVSVLTVSNPSVPLQDESLCAEIPKETIVRYAKTLEPGYALKKAVSGTGEQAVQKKPSLLKRAIKGALRWGSNVVLQPDAQVLWHRNAVREGMRLLNEIPHDAIVVSAPPFSSFLIGASLSRQSGLPLILDYRDEWDISNAYWENKGQGLLSRKLQAWMQRRVARAASVLLATTQHSADALAQVAATAHSTARVSHIYNGYDAHDFKNIDSEDPAKNDRYRLAYVGTLWNLTSVEPLVAAVEKLAADSPNLAEQLELVFAGRRTGPQEEILNRLEGLPVRVIKEGYMDHEGAIRLMHSANGLLAFLSDVPHAGRVVPSKIFEYMATRRTIFSVAPEGEVSTILRDCPMARIHTPSDIDGITQSLALEIERFSMGVTFPPEYGLWDPAQYERKNLTGQLAGLLDEISGLMTDSSTGNVGQEWKPETENRK